MLALPESLREEVRRPFGRVFRGGEVAGAAREAARPLVSVGDQCCADLIDAGIAPDILVFDFKIRREEIPRAMKEKLAPHAREAYVVLSGAGSISEGLEEAIARVLGAGKGAVLVVGEDDLSSLLVMARAKAGTLFYGQPGEGAVAVALGGREIMQKARGLLARMEKV